MSTLETKVTKKIDQFISKYWYHFYNGFGMTQSLTGDWTRDLPHSKPALYH